MSFHHRHTTKSILLSLGVLLMSSCGGDNEQTAAGPASQPELHCNAQSSSLDDPRLAVAGSDESFMKVARSYLNEISTAGCATQREGATDTNGAAPPAAIPGSAEGGGGSSAAPTTPVADDWRSGTNVQELGVDEADLVETDGHHLYIANAGTRYGFGAIPVGRATMGIMPALADDPATAAPSPDATAAFVRIMTLDNDAPSARELARINLPNTASNVHGIYLRNTESDQAGAQLLVVAGGTVKEAAVTTFGTLVFAYDVSNPANPQLTWTLGVGSNHATSRLHDGKLYLVESNSISQVPVPMPPIDAEPTLDVAPPRNVAEVTPADLLPPIYLDGETKNFVKASECLVPMAANPDLYVYPDLVTVLAIDLTDPNNSRGLCTLESSGDVYMSNSGLYLARSNGSETLVHKIRFTPNGMEYAASGAVPGYIGGTNTRFAMSEKAQDLRVVTTEYSFSIDGPGVTPGGAGSGGIATSPPSDSGSTPPVSTDTSTVAPMLARAVDDPTHRLFILREDADAKLLKQIASLPNDARPRPLGKVGELLRGVRFVGDWAYLVTFKKTDPFYVIDLSDPQNPFIAGELLLPGYSDYLQPLGENLVLGVGKDAVEEGDFAWYQGVKVGVFDVSDPAKPKVLGEKLIGERGTESPALYDHHAVTVLSDSQTGVHRIAIPVQVHETLADRPGEIRGPSTYYEWTYNGLFLFSVADGSADQPASFVDEGVMVGDRADNASGHYDYGAAHRSILVGDAVHYASDDGVWSAKWQTPNLAVGPQ